MKTELEILIGECFDNHFLKKCLVLGPSLDYISSLGMMAFSEPLDDAELVLVVYVIMTIAHFHVTLASSKANAKPAFRFYVYASWWCM